MESNSIPLKTLHIKFEASLSNDMGEDRFQVKMQALQQISYFTISNFCMVDDFDAFVNAKTFLKMYTFAALWRMVFELMQYVVSDLVTPQNS